MAAALSLTELRKDLFRHVDGAIESGSPIVVKRRGRTYELQMRPVEAAEPVSAEERWARYDAWITERRARGEIPAEPRDDDGVWLEELESAKADALAEMHAEWDEFYGPDKPSE